MSAVIDTIIPEQAYERIRDQIALILGEELPHQLGLGVTDAACTVVLERNRAVQSSDTPIVNVLLASGAFDNQDQLSTDGTYTFFIEAYTKGKSTDGDLTGDKLSNKTCQRLLGLCRAILENPAYKTLAFAAPFSMNRKAVRLDIEMPRSADATNTSMGRLTFSVRAIEKSPLQVPTTQANMLTNVKIETGPDGYQYVKNFTP